MSSPSPPISVSSPSQPLKVSLPAVPLSVVARRWKLPAPHVVPSAKVALPSRYWSPRNQFVTVMLSPPAPTLSTMSLPTRVPVMSAALMPAPKARVLLLELYPLITVS